MLMPAQSYAQIGAINKLSGAVAKPASINLRKWFLSPTGLIKPWFHTEGNLPLWSSYLPLGFPNWVAKHRQSVPSSFEESDLKKAKKDGFLPEAAQVIFPGDECVPTLPKGYRVMFLAFLLHGLSLPAHEFLRGLLFVYGVQLHQLTPNSSLHITCFITLCESFHRIDPHWVLWKFLFRLCPSVSLAKNLELGGAIVSMRSKSHYLEFNMAALVQGWRQKWFFIKDQKATASDQYGLPLFDATQSLAKLTPWDAPPSEAEVEVIKPLLTRIQRLKSAVGGGPIGTQLMVFFLQRRIQPLQSRASKLWSYSGSADPSRVSDQDPEKKDLNKRVSSLTTLTA
jgi:hypothetical protein